MKRRIQAIEEKIVLEFFDYFFTLAAIRRLKRDIKDLSRNYHF